MKKFKQHLGLGIAAVLAAAAVIVLAVMVLPLYGSISDTTTAIRGLADEIGSSARTNPMPTAADVSTFNDIKVKIDAKKAAVTKFYADHDVQLESWFPDVDLRGGVPATPASFAGKLRSLGSDGEQSLQKRTLDALPMRLGYSKIDPAVPPAEFQVAYGFNWEDVSGEAGVKLTGEEMRLLQKRYWIREMIAGLATDPALKVHRLLEVDFLRRLPGLDKPNRPPTPNAPWYPNAYWELGWFPGVAATSSSNLQSRIDNEVLLPAGQGETITFGVALMIPYETIPSFLEELMKVKDKKPLVHVVAVKIYLQEQNPFTYTDTVNPGEKAPLDKAKETEYGSRYPVLAVTGYVIDFKSS